MPRPKVPVASLASPDDIELQFYDIEQLMSVWADEDDIVCVHPGGPRIVGAQAIRASFDAIFGNGNIDVHADSVRRVHNDSCAVHSVLEQVRVVGEQGPQAAWVLATNVYFKTTQGWRLVAHHASPGAQHHAQEVVDAPSTLH
jgi:ketosteroid isomerase-like protein